MDTTDKDIQFNEQGICNHCLEYQENEKIRTFSGNEAKKQLELLVNKIKTKGRKKEYDCIIGVSGGVDSTYTAYKCKELGLRPLAVHFDNGWDSELAVSNIEKVLNILGIELYTYVVDWEEFKDLQLSFLKASTPDCEIPTDHGIYAILMRIAVKKNIKYIISGMNFKTESILPLSWSYGHIDWRYIRNVHKNFGQTKLKTFPRYNILYLFYVSIIRRIRFISLLNYIDYDREEAMDILQEKVGWKYYGGKHYESIYTRFFQSFILPNKFNIDKRKAHLSNLINSGQLKKKEALMQLKTESYSYELLENDHEYVLKKLSLTEKEFQDIMKSPIKSFLDYKNNYRLTRYLRIFLLFLRKRGCVSK